MVEDSYERKYIGEINSEAILWDGLDDAIIGVTPDGKAVYDIEILVSLIWKMSENFMDIEEAREWVDFNILSTYAGEHTPIHIWKISKNEIKK